MDFFDLRLVGRTFALTMITLTTTAGAVAQNSNNSRLKRQQELAQRNLQLQMQNAAANQPQLPSDPQLLGLHREFIVKAEKLAAEYERKKQYDRAREVFEAMARLVPNHGEAEAGLQRIKQVQTMKDRKFVDVQANGAWQDTGITLQADMPVHIEVRGTWKVVLETGPEGVQIPDRMRPRDGRIKLGTLIGVIASSAAELESAKPFPIKPSDDFVNKKSGRLYLRMFDVEPSDNEGKLYVMVHSTFGK